MKLRHLFPCLLLLVGLLFQGCFDANLPKYYGTAPHVYVTANAFDSTTAVEVTATWDAQGKVTLSSRLIPFDPTIHSPGFAVDMPKTEYNDSTHTITPTRSDVVTIGITYDAQGRMSQQAFEAKKVVRFCCQNVCNRECNCTDPIHVSNYWYCTNMNGTYCHSCCQVRFFGQCGTVASSDPPYAAFIQSTGIGTIKTDR